MDENENESKEAVPQPEQSLDSDEEWKDVERPEPDLSSPPVSRMDGNKSDVASKGTTDEETTPEKKFSSTKILCIVIGFLVVVAVVITAVLLSYDGKQSNSEPAAIIPTTPVAPTASADNPAPMGSPVASPTGEPAVPSPTQAATNSPTLSPTASPTIDLAGKVVEFLATNQVVVNQQDPSANLAVDVLANETLGVLDPTSAPKIIQRFAMLTVDFAIRAASLANVTVTETSAPVNDDGSGTSAPIDGNVTATTAPMDGNATSDLADGNSTGGFFQVDSGNGTTDATTGGSFFNVASMGPFGGIRHLQMNLDECLWTGVSCVDGTVTDLNYYGQQLQGTIPTEIGLLADLKHIDLSQNELKGTIPEEFYQLTKLQQLFLHHNQLTGTISNSVGNWWNLTHLHLSHNQLSGTIPATMASGTNIRPYFHINFKNNKMTGTIPSNLRWRNVTYVDLGSNQLTGTLPDDLGQTFSKLRHFFLDNNQFQGTLPESYLTVGNGRMEQFEVNNNQLTGTVPSGHTQFNYLNLYRLDGNNFVSMSDTTCRLSVLVGGENVEFKVDCDICTCRDDLFCREC